MRIGLVACVKSKLDHAAPAKDLYTSPLFRGGRAAVETGCDRWYVQSAKHGLLTPGTVVEPYEQTLSTASRAEKRTWSNRVLHDLQTDVGLLADHVFEIHAGTAYHGWGLSDGLRHAGADVDLPTEGLSLGRKLAFYADSDPVAPTRGASSRAPRPEPGKAAGPATQRSHRRPSSGSLPGPKYWPLYEHLQQLPSDRWSSSFDAIEEILGQSLPDSARSHNAWWANDPSHSHARSWLSAGWRTREVRPAQGSVTFVEVRDGAH